MNGRVQAGLFEALKAEKRRRSAAIDDYCGGDLELRRQLEELLPAYEQFEEEIEVPLILREGIPDLDSESFTRGTQVGAYVIDHKLGGGGMGIVFLGSRADDSFQKQVAIKIVRNAVHSSLAIDRFQRERQILANLEHPNIARLLDGGLTRGGVPYLVMEYVRGQPLDQFCQERDLSVVKKVKLFQQVCLAVGYAHQNLVIHRDLKPSNILVSDEGIPYLLDFGVATLIAGDELGAAPTGTGQVALTPEYASPEQIRGQRVNTTSDVYSLGIVLFELLTGKRPYQFTTRSMAEIVTTVCDAVPPLPSSVNGDRRLSGDLDAILLKALRKEPDLRYESVQSFSGDLDRYLEGLPVKAARAGFLYRLKKFGRRNRVTVIAGTLVAVSLLAGVIGTSWQARVADHERESAQIERGRALEEARRANQQRALVEQSMNREKEQREFAELSAAEARRQRGLAVAEKQKADTRFNDIRKLSASFLFEFDAAIANVNGALKGRELVVAKGLEYLEKLSRDSDGNDSLNEDIAAAYERLAGIQGNIYQSNLGQFKKAAESYERALAIRRVLVSRHPANDSMRLALANSHIQLADGLFTSGNLHSAIEHHRTGIRTLEEIDKLEGQFKLADAGLQRSHSRLCTLVLAAGDISGALGHCETARQISTRMLAVRPLDPALRSNAGVAYAGLGTVLRTQKKPQLAIGHFERAAREFEKLYAEFPANSGYGRNLAGTYTQLGVNWSDVGDRLKAVEYQRRSIETLRRMLTTAPEDVRLRTTLGFSSIRLAPALLAAGKREDALVAGREGLEVFRSLADRPEATPDDLNNYASFLLEIGIPELHDAQKALNYSKRAVAAVRTPNLALMSTLADAYCGTGDIKEAANAAKRGLAENPAPDDRSVAVGLRVELAGKLKAFADGKCN